MNGFGLKQYSFIEYVKKLIDKINHRFDHFEKDQTEKRIWSIEIFESIVAFHINKASETHLLKLLITKVCVMKQKILDIKTTKMLDI